MKTALLRARAGLVWFHRWAGLAMAGFLLLTGLTGSLLVWSAEIDRFLWPVLREVPAPAAAAVPLDALALRDAVRIGIPDARTGVLRFPDHSAGVHPVRFPLRAEAGDDEVYVDPYTGRELGRRRLGDLSQGARNVVPFLQILHESLAMGATGAWLLGVVALAWTLDCFVGLLLTLPVSGRLIPAWGRAWQVAPRRLNFDLHRASGLWFLPMCLAIAWSGVGFNLREVYRPVMHAVFTVQEDWQDIPDRPRPWPRPALGEAEALARARHLAALEGQRLGFSVLGENALRHVPAKGMYVYAFTSEYDIERRGGGTQVWMDGDSGLWLRTIRPLGQASGNTVSNVLAAFHTAGFGGFPLRLLVCATGVVVALLSVTGIVIWLQKRRAGGACRA